MVTYKKVEDENDDLSINGDSSYTEADDAEPVSALPRKEKVGMLSRFNGFNVIVAGCVAFAAVITVALVIDIILKDPITGHGAVSSEIGECSVAAAKLMKTGGNGIDAAVACAFCVSVFNLGSSGIGSGGYMLIHGPNGADKAIDFQFMASANSSKGMFESDHSLAKKGGLSVAVPGFVHGLKIAHEKFGKLSWNRLLTPAIEFARNGFEIHSFAADMIKNHYKSMSQEMKDVVAPNGKMPSVGALVKYPKLADMLEDVAVHGTDSIYKSTGKIQKEILDVVSSNAGILTPHDFESYSPTMKDCISGDYNGYRLLTSSLPSSGIVLLSALKAVDEFHLSSRDSPESYQVIVEALKFAFAGRSFMGDPAFNEDMSNITKHLLSSDYAKELKDKITLNATHEPSYYRDIFNPSQTPGTSHISVMGPNEELISLTTTLGLPFGSGLSTKSGIALNNGMMEFSLPQTAGSSPPNMANFIEPLKRPLSAASPLIVFNEEKPCEDMLVLGASGGKKIISSLLQVLVDVISYGIPLHEAIERPRIHHQLYPNEIQAEGKRFASVAGLSSIIADLRKIGHTVNDSSTALGLVNGIALKKGDILAYSDTRNNGTSAQF